MPEMAFSGLDTVGLEIPNYGGVKLPKLVVAGIILLQNFT